MIGSSIFTAVCCYLKNVKLSGIEIFFVQMCYLCAFSAKFAFNAKLVESIMIFRNFLWIIEMFFF